MTTVLALDNKYNNIKIVIDITTFRYDGVTQGYTDNKADSYISFVLAITTETDSTVELLKNSLKLNVDNKDKYVGCKKVFEDYEKDKRPRIWIRLSSGYAGIANPSEFHFKSI